MQVSDYVKQPGQRFRLGLQGFNAAATSIQSVARMGLQRIAYRRLKERTAASIVIQTGWSIFRKLCNTKKAIHKAVDMRNESWRTVMQHFMETWPEVVLCIVLLHRTIKLPFDDHMLPGFCGWCQFGGCGHFGPSKEECGSPCRRTPRACYPGWWML